MRFQINILCCAFRCTAPEQKMNIPEGVLKKDSKSHDEKTKDLEADIKKKLKQLEQMHVRDIFTVVT